MRLRNLAKASAEKNEMIQKIQLKDPRIFIYPLDAYTKSKHVNKIIIHSAALCKPQLQSHYSMIFSVKPSFHFAISKSTPNKSRGACYSKRNECMMVERDADKTHVLNAQHFLMFCMFVCQCCDLGGGLCSQSFGFRYDLK